MKKLRAPIKSKSTGKEGAPGHASYRMFLHYHFRLLCWNVALFHSRSEIFLLPVGCFWISYAKIFVVEKISHEVADREYSLSFFHFIRSIRSSHEPNRRVCNETRFWLLRFWFGFWFGSTLFLIAVTWEFFFWGSQMRGCPNKDRFCKTIAAVTFIDT